MPQYAVMSAFTLISADKGSVSCRKEPSAFIVIDGLAKDSWAD